MIARYSRPEMSRIWEDDRKFQRWLDVELAVCDAHAAAGRIPKAAVAVIRAKARFEPARIRDIEKTVQHDVIAFLTNVAEHVGPEARYIHLGLTSNDVVDTAQAFSQSTRRVFGENSVRYLSALNAVADMMLGKG